jgi:Tol biopolymer transport system component
MTAFDRFESHIPSMLDELAAPRTPDYANDLFARTAATRQRPGWTFPERWIPVTALARRFAAAPRIPWRLGILVALLAVAALVVALAAGALNQRPAPFGPAGNGRIAFTDNAGRILTGDLRSGTATVIVDTPGNKLPQFSPDGGRIAFLRLAADGVNVDIVVATADGSKEIVLTPRPMLEPSYVGWTATGDRLLVNNIGGQLLLFDTTKTATPTVLSDLLGVQSASVGLGYNFRSTAAFQPPTGDRIAFVTNETELATARLDGTALTTLLTPASSGLDYRRVGRVEWSPDGTQLVVCLEFQGQVERWHPYVLNADGSGLRPLASLSTDPLVDVNSPLWSPDGTRIAFQSWLNHADGQGVDFQPITVVDVATGAMHKVGPTSNDGYIWQWSPDGRSILVIPGGTSDALVIDAATGAVTTAPWRADQPIDWQRVKP